MSKIKISGIYAIRNKINNKRYVGSSKSVYYRWKQQHLTELRSNTHFNTYLQYSWNKYGEDNFEFIVIEECDLKLLTERESFWIEHYKSWDRQFGYNLIRIVNGRIVMSEETRLKMSNNLKQRWNTKLETYYTEGIHAKILQLYESGISKNSIAKQLRISRELVYSCLEHNNLHVNEGKGNIIKLTKEKQKEILKLRNEGTAWEEISKQTGISYTHLHRKDFIGSGEYKTKSKKRTAYKTITEDIKIQAIEMRKEGKSWKDIAATLGVDRTTFYKHKLNVGNENMVRQRITPELKEKILNLRKDNLSWAKIAIMLGISENSIYNNGLNHENKKT
jgi:group I intron endonuclease